MGSEQHLLNQFMRDWESEASCIEAHTSGSTGKPKLISLPKSDMAASARATCHQFGIDASSLLWLPLSINYIAGKMMVVRSIISGAKLEIEQPSRRILARKPSTAVTLMSIVPSQVDGLLESPHAHMVDNVIVGGAPPLSRGRSATAASPLSCLRHLRHDRDLQSCRIA